MIHTELLKVVYKSEPKYKLYHDNPTLSVQNHNLVLYL